MNIFFIFFIKWEQSSKYVLDWSHFSKNDHINMPQRYGWFASEYGNGRISFSMSIKYWQNCKIWENQYENSSMICTICTKEKLYLGDRGLEFRVAFISTVCISNICRGIIDGTHMTDLQKLVIHTVKSFDLSFFMWKCNSR